MLRNARAIVFLICLAAASLSFAQWVRAPLKVPAQRNPNLYRADADAQQEIAEAVTEAGKDHKRILLVFGATWCSDCYALDYGFHQPRIEPLLNANFKVVHVDVGRFNRNLNLVKKYHVDLEKGIPSLAVLAPTGGVLYATAKFERARVMTEQDIVDFLSAWKPPAQK